MRRLYDPGDRRVHGAGDAPLALNAFVGWAAKPNIRAAAISGRSHASRRRMLGFASLSANLRASSIAVPLLNAHSDALSYIDPKCKADAQRTASAPALQHTIAQANPFQHPAVGRR